MTNAPRDTSWLLPASTGAWAAVNIAALTHGRFCAFPGSIKIALGATAIGLTFLIFRRQKRALRTARTVADAVQHGMLRPPPVRVGGLRTEVRYMSCEEGASVGGDVYDAVDTPFGVRILIGDVMGKGLPAVSTAMDTLGAFRELAQHEKTLTGVAQRMDAVLAHRAGCEQFVTALLVAISDGEGSAELVCCGHPPPLLIRTRRCTFIDALPPAPPLGLLHLTGSWCRASSVPLADGDRLLLYTDGVTEARDKEGVFYPLAERVSRIHDADPVAFLDALTEDLIQYSMGRLQDDAALLLVDYGDSRTGIDQPRAGKDTQLRDALDRS
ncbi:PP2C family protein-serine/threonine phosphatase [Streptomyces monticola]|uniref:PP2C family protein-serine/threonine phosphatase n=1 Tax=Streptomyces monticola TaxID=2666263 RepID=A0ABW2JNQ3_9ACTN